MAAPSYSLTGCLSGPLELFPLPLPLAGFSCRHVVMGCADGFGGAGPSVFIGELGADAAFTVPEAEAVGLSLAFPFG